MGSLVTHVCSGVSGEVDVALELLCELVTQRPADMARYAIFVKVGAASGSKKPPFATVPSRSGTDGGVSGRASWTTWTT